MHLRLFSTCCCVHFRSASSSLTTPTRYLTVQHHSRILFNGLSSLPAPRSFVSHSAMSASSNSSTMKGVVVSSPGPASNLQISDSLPRPVAQDNELLIKVHGTAVNRADTLQREGKYPPPPGASHIMGLECVGEVVGRGSKVPKDTLPNGSRVMALLPGGGYAQYVTVDAGSAIPIPDHLDWVQASAIPEVFFTAFLISRQLGKMKQGDVVLIHAGASGVGTALIQLANLFGAIPIVSVSSSEKIEYCKNLGAAFGVNYKTSENWAAEIKEFTSKLPTPRDGVDLILDPVGASHAVQNLESLALDGRWVLYGSMGGVNVTNFPLGLMLRKRAQLIGTTLRNRTLDFKKELIQTFQKECLHHFGGDNPKLKPIIEKQLKLEQIREAHELMESNKTIGKVVLTVD